MRLSLKKSRDPAPEDVTTSDAPVEDPAGTGVPPTALDDPAVATSMRGYTMPTMGFDLLEGSGRSKAATTQMNAIVAGVMLLAVAASAFLAYNTVTTRDARQATLVQLDSDIADTTQAIRQRSSSILPEQALVTHREQRRSIILTAYGEMLPYDAVFADVTGVAEQTGVTLNRLTFDGSERDDGLVVSGTAPDLDVLGLFSIELTNRFGIARPAGYIETVEQSYTQDQGVDTITFTARMRVNTSQLSALNGCRRVELYLDGEVPECDEVLEALADYDNGTGVTSADPAADTTSGDGDADPDAPATDTASADAEDE